MNNGLLWFIFEVSTLCVGPTFLRRNVSRRVAHCHSSKERRDRHWQHCPIQTSSPPPSFAVATTTRRLSVVRTVHETTRSESEGAPGHPKMPQRSLCENTMRNILISSRRPKAAGAKPCPHRIPLHSQRLSMRIMCGTFSRRRLRQRRTRQRVPPDYPALSASLSENYVRNILNSKITPGTDGTKPGPT